MKTEQYPPALCGAAAGEKAAGLVAAGLPWACGWVFQLPQDSETKVWGNYPLVNYNITMGNHNF